MFQPSRIKGLPRSRRAALRVERMAARTLQATSVIGPISVPPHPGTTPPISADLSFPPIAFHHHHHHDPAPISSPPAPPSPTPPATPPAA